METDDIGIIVADNSNDESIKEMCRQSKVVLNCVGPVSGIMLILFRFKQPMELISWIVSSVPWIVSWYLIFRCQGLDYLAFENLAQPF